MLEITKQNLEKAIERAKQNKMLVKCVEFRRYEVLNRANGNRYEVHFTKIAGRKFADCTCPATVICKHIGASIGHHVVLASQMSRQTV
jgi:uncharacterized Zn finger protein